jgi:DNA-binding CsgD family transcriptional regulator/PAS domain-containing protein
MVSGAQTQLDQCIDKLYGALTAPQTLVDAVHSIRLMLGASGATHLQYSAPDGRVIGMVDDGHDPESQQQYMEYYAALDPTRPLVHLRQGEWLWDDRVLDPRYTREREFVNDFAPRIGMRYFMGYKLYEGEKGIASFSIQRGSDAPPFDTETHALMRELQPHFTRVFRMMIEMAPAMPALASATAAMDMLRMPVCVVDDTCKLVYANPAAEELFARGDTITVTGGQLRCPRPEADVMLLRAIRLACQSPRQASAFSPEPKGPAVTRLQVRAMPLAEQLPLACRGHGKLVLLFLASGSAPPQVKELQQLYGLTRAEAELVRLVAQGASPEVCAVRRRVSVATVRTQLRSVYEKTGVGSQTQLLSMVLALPALR